MLSNKELQEQLDLATEKLGKMTSTVKQLGTKLKKSNDDLRNVYWECQWYKTRYKEVHSQIEKLTLTVDEAHERALQISKSKDLRNKF